MEANELRIGNYVAAKDGKSFQVKLHHINKLQSEKCKFYGIPITEEWLLKFGFVKENKRETEHHSNFYTMCVYDYKYSFAYADFRNDWGFYHSYTDALNDSDNNKFDFLWH